MHNDLCYVHRCVADEQRSLALGVQSFLFRLLGNVPGPIVFGVIFDAACIFFRFDVPCMKQGNCWVYDNYQLSWSILTVVLVGIAFSFTFSFLTWLTYPKQSVSDKESLTDHTGLEFTTSAVPLAQTGETGEMREERRKFEAINNESNLISNSVWSLSSETVITTTH